MSPYLRRPSVRHADRVLARSVLLALLGLLGLTTGSGPAGPGAEARYRAACAVLDGGAPGRSELGPDGGAPAGLPGERAGTPGALDVLVSVPFVLLGRGIDAVLPPAPPAVLAAGGREARDDALVRVVATARGPFLGAWTGWLVVLVARRIGARRRPALALGLASGLGTFLWPASRVAAPEALATVALFAAFHVLLRLRESYDRLRDPARWLFPAAGSLLALAAGSDPIFVPASLWLLALVLAGVQRGHRRLRTTRWTPDGRRGGYLLDLVLLVAPYLGLLLLALLRTPGAGAELVGLAEVGGAALPGALATLLVSPGHGLLVMAPGVLLLPLALRVARRQGERLWLAAVLGLAVALLVPAVLRTAAEGPIGYGPHALLPLVPFLYAGLALLPRSSPSPWRARALVLLTLLGVLVQLPAAVLDPAAERELARQARGVELALGEADHARELGHALDALEAAWDPRMAAPLTMWRILRRRVAVGDGHFPVREVFLIDSEVSVRLPAGREADAWHLGLAVLAPRLGGLFWFLPLFVCALLVVALVLALQGIDPAAP